MKETYDEDPIENLQINPIPKTSPQKNIIIEQKQKTHFIINIHFPPNKSFSFKVPNTWTMKKLISFILSTFKQEFTKSLPMFLFKGNLLQQNSETLLKDIFNYDKLNNIITTFKERNKSENDQNKSNILDNIFKKANKEVYKTNEFCEIEKHTIQDYINLFKEDSFVNFPLMNPAYNQRREQLKSEFSNERLAGFEPIPLEDFPIRNYFQFNILFKCFISFFAVGLHIKGINFILFLFVLVIYYWYCINNIIDEFYKEKFQQIGLSEEEYKRISTEGIFNIKELGKKRGLFSIDKDKDNEKEEEEEESEDEKNENNNDKNKEDIIYEEKTDENISNNINKEVIDNLDLENNILNENKDFNINLGENNKNDFVFSMEPMEDLKFKEDEKEKEIKDNSNNINENFNQKRYNNLNLNINKNIFKSKNKLEKREVNKKEEKEGERREEENERKSALQIAYEILYLFIISFIPALSDEFEANNPMPSTNHHNDNNNDENLNNNINDNNNIINNINEQNNINNIDNNNIENSPLDNNHQEEDSNNNKMTSSKVVNMSEDSNRDYKMFNLIKKDNQSLNEKEYVFSEHGGIDSLSMNSEIYKQKKEKDKEKEKEKDKDKDKEKEQQIFEEDEENKNDEDKHLKNE